MNFDAASRRPSGRGLGQRHRVCGSINSAARTPSETKPHQNSLTLSEPKPTLTGIRVLLIEDHRLLREGLTRMFNRQTDVNVVATLETCDRILEHLRKIQVHLVLMDTNLLLHEVPAVVSAIKNDFPNTKLIVMGLGPSQSDVLSLIQLGVSGFLCRDATFAECLQTVRAVAKGTNVLPSALTSALFSAITDKATRHTNSSIFHTRASTIAMKPGAPLTVREREIVELIVEGLSNKEIAQRLNIAIFTVKSHVHNLLEKLALRSRLQLACQYSHRRQSQII